MLFSWGSMKRDTYDWPPEWWHITSVPRSDVLSAAIRVPHFRGEWLKVHTKPAGRSVPS